MNRYRYFYPVFFIVGYTIKAPIFILSLIVLIRGLTRERALSTPLSLLFISLGFLTAVRDSQFEEKQYFMTKEKYRNEWKKPREKLSVVNPVEKKDRRHRLIGFVKRHGGSNLLLALSTGKRSFSEREKGIFLKTGTLHLVAISAFHIGMLFLFLHLLFRLILPLTSFSPFLLQLIFLIIKSLLLINYLQLTGWAVPTLRAALFILILDVAGSFGRTIHSYFALSISLILTALTIPGSFTSPSFIMSALAIFTVISLIRTMPSIMMVQIVSLTLVINTVLLPVTVSLSGFISPMAPIANLIAIPLVSLIVPITILLQFIWELAPFLAHFLISCGDGLCRILEVNLSTISKTSTPILIPTVELAPISTVVFFLSFLLIRFTEGRWRYLSLCLFLTLSLLHFLPVGQNRGVRRIYSFPGKAYCVNEGSGRGRIVEERRYIFPGKLVRKRLRKLVSGIERDMARCGISRVESIHAAAPLPEKALEELLKRPRFSKAKIFVREMIGYKSYGPRRSHEAH